ncbi:MAG TPA: 2-oxoglutarate dehydrogenase E1 component [Gemmatimonadaceae bacterium]|nr:2-oxoglutarate dehydrogenase E1 component [Gemmatimonadaceae bacterium]
MPEPAFSVFNDGYAAEVYEAYRIDPNSVDESWRQLFRFAEQVGGPAAIVSAPPSAPGAPVASVPPAAPSAQFEPAELAEELPARAAPTRPVIETEPAARSAPATRPAPAEPPTPVAATATDADATAKQQAFARTVVGISRYLNSIRRYGYLAVQLDPLGSPPPGARELTLEHYGIVETDLERVTGAALGFPHLRTGRDVADRLKYRYTRNLAVEFVHCGTEDERQWFREVFTAEQLTRPLTADEKKSLLTRLTEVDGLERFIGRAFVGFKRFSIEGTDALVPMLDTAVEESVRSGARHVAIAMSHRGRINVLAHVLGKPVDHIFNEFQGRHDHIAGASTGDVKYHLGFEGARVTRHGHVVHLSLVPNPSHLEIVNPVLQGYVRAHQRQSESPAQRDDRAVVPICIHGDAAFPGEGIVAETFNLARLAGFDVGGTLHIIVNNQIGFTTDPRDARSTRFASDLAKGFEMPVVHVNADDAEGCVIAMRLAVAYRTQFARDFLVDLVGYRRHGHNEGDEPTYTQPQLYARIKTHPTARQVWGERLVREGLVTQAYVDAADQTVAANFQAIIFGSKDAVDAPAIPPAEQETAEDPPVTAVPAAQLKGFNTVLLTWPGSFHPHPRLAKQLERRRDALAGEPSIDWGHAEALAFASILADGTSVRMSGQDAERGTFSHRHAVLHDVTTDAVHVPLQHVAGPNVAFEIHNSSLSELAVMGFEYGFSTAASDTITLWEAQFGDFSNMAQPLIDQFLSADRAKWGQDSGLVLLLPHGYEGQGPEHSSARLERFLQLCAEENMCVAYPSTPAQYFHILRRQARRKRRRPLVLMQPKSLLRLAQAASRVGDLSEGRFQTVIDDPIGASKRDAVRRIVFCTGKIYYDLTAKPPGNDIAVVRVEELYPWPHDEVSRVLDLYPQVKDVAWVQEEPKNMGAWSYVAPRLRGSVGNALVIRYIGRTVRASPAEGQTQAHAEEQARIVAEAVAVPARVGSRTPGGVMRAV